MHVSDAELLEVVDASGLAGGVGGSGFGKSEELAFVCDAAVRCNAEVAMMHLINHGVGESVELRAAVVVPAGGVCGAEVNDGSTLAVDAYGFSPYAGRLSEPLAVVLDAEGVELAVEGGVDTGTPDAVAAEPHLEGVNWSGVSAVVVDKDLHGVGFRRPEGEAGAHGINFHLEVFACVSRIGSKDIFHGFSGGSGGVS